MGSQSNVAECRQALVDTINTVYSQQSVDEKLRELKEKGQRRWDRNDIIWFEIIMSLATQGGSHGSQLVLNDDGQIDEHKYGSVAFRTLEQIDPDHRYAYLEARLHGTVRFQSMKAKAIEDNFNLLKEKYDNPLGAKMAFINEDGPEAKIKLLKQFSRIGKKYARNIPMDLYLDDFHDFIAIDSRIKGILKEVGYPVDNREYIQTEEFLRTVSSELEMEVWELDRILYNFEDNIQASIKS